jgi:hypothetical protein
MFRFAINIYETSILLLISAYSYAHGFEDATNLLKNLFEEESTEYVGSASALVTFVSVRFCVCFSGVRLIF